MAQMFDYTAYHQRYRKRQKTESTINTVTQQTADGLIADIDKIMPNLKEYNKTISHIDNIRNDFKKDDLDNEGGFMDWQEKYI